MTLLADYDHAVAKRVIQPVPAQREVLVSFERMLAALEQPVSRLPWKRRNGARGMYLYGPVGSGKTSLVDYFLRYVRGIPFGRFHFHEFMQQVDARLRQLQGTRNPVHQLAEQMVRKTRLLCLDEFMVEDVAHATMLAELLQVVFDRGILLVATSNTPVDELYRNGMMRERFVPAITLIKARCEILELDAGQDLRLGKSARAGSWYLTAERERMHAAFLELAPDARTNVTLQIQNRPLPAVYCGARAVWFSFDGLCDIPRSQLDYLEIANRFETVYLEGVPRPEAVREIQWLLLIHCIDVFYDRGVRLVLSSEADAATFMRYHAGVAGFERTVSRLQEMQSGEYFFKHPRPPLENENDSRYHSL